MWDTGWIASWIYIVYTEMPLKVSFFSFLLLPLLSCAQEYHFPESAAYDVDEGVSYITNFSGNTVFKVYPNGMHSVFLDEVTHPLGTVLEQGILYFNLANQCIKGARIEDGVEVFSIIIEEAGFLNDLTSDGDGALYASDSQTGKIFRVDVAKQTYRYLTNTGFASLNGIIHDADKHRLIFCDFSEKGQVGEYDLESNEMNIIPVFLGMNLDGIAADKDFFYFASWGPGSFQEGFQENGGAIYRIAKDFTDDKTTLCKDLKGQADIYYASSLDALIVPLGLGDKVEFVSLKQNCCSKSKSSISEDAED